MIPDDFFIRELIEDEDIIFSKDSEYHKQKKKEKKNPIFKGKSLNIRHFKPNLASKEG